MADDDIVYGGEDELTPQERKELEKEQITPFDAPVLEDLTDEECYLYAILTDHSGLDQAEFLWYEPNNLDGCFRAWPYQWKWWRTDDVFQIDQSARSVGKSLSIKVRAFAFPFLFPGQEMVITAPELVHLEPIIGLIENQFYNTRIGREMLPRGRSAVTHRPFQMNFRNSARIIGRIPQRDGKGVKGIHPIWLELDEAQDYPKPGWTELTETLKRGFAGARWRAHGVTRGARDEFYKRTQDRPDNEWTVHRYPAMFRPNWTDEERQEKIKEYGDREDPDYRRNVNGAHGDATNPLFVLHRLMNCVDMDETSVYNTDEYFLSKIKYEHIMDGTDITSFLDFPFSHKRYIGNSKNGRPKAKYWVGMDVGYTVDPSEILVFVEYHRKPSDEDTTMRLLSRIQLVRMGPSDQVKAMMHVIDFYQPTAFGMDANGNGEPLFTLAREQLERNQGPVSKDRFIEVIKDYKFGQKRPIDFDPTVELEEWDDPRDHLIVRELKEYSSDKMRLLVDQRRIELPWDRDLNAQFQGATWMPAPSGSQDQYGRRIFSKGNDHILDAARFAVLGWSQYGIEQVLKEDKTEPIFVSFIGG